jgi:hypothetical protein
MDQTQAAQINRSGCTAAQAAQRRFNTTSKNADVTVVASAL